MEDTIDTTIRISSEIKKRLDDLKVHPRQSYNEIIEQIIEQILDNRVK